MNPSPLVDRLVCLVIVILCLAVFLLVALSPQTFMSTTAVYKGF